MPSLPNLSIPRTTIMPPSRFAVARGLLVAMAEPAVPKIIEDLTDELVIEALQANRGNIAKAALTLEKSRAQVAQFIARRPELILLRNELREAIIDKAEDNIFAAVEAGDIAQSNFVVATLGKARGWASRQELTGADGKDLPPPRILIRRYEPEDDPPEEVAIVANERI